MARISSYDSPQVTASVLPGVQISDAPARDMAAVGASTAQALGSVAGVVNEFAQREREKADAAAKMEIDNHLSELENSTLYDPDSGMLGRQGKDAIGLGKEFEPVWSKREQEIVQGAPSRLRQWAQAQAGERRQNAQRILMRHSMSEGQKYYVSQASTMADNAVNLATLNYQDHERVDQEAARAQVAADQLNKLNGGDDASGALLRAAAASKTYRAVIERKMADDPSAAAAYLESVKQHLTGEDATRLEMTLRPVLADADAARWIADATVGRASISGAPIEGAAKTIQDAESIARGSIGRTVSLESGGKSDAHNPNSSATGAAQFIDSTWLRVVGQYRPELVAGKSRADILAMRNDPALSRQMAEAYAVENARGLFESGLPVTPETVYLAHHFGLGGARQLLRSAPDTKVSSVLPPKVVAANPYLAGKTVGELVANHQQRAGEHSAPAAASVDGRPDYDALEQRAMNIPNPILRERVMSRLQTMSAIEARAAEDARRVMSSRVYQVINADPTVPLSKALSPSDYANLAASGKLPEMESYRKKMVEGQLVQDDPALVDQIERQAALQPDAFLRRDLHSDANRLSGETLRRFSSMQQEGQAKSEKSKDWSTDEQRMDMVFRMVGVGREADATGKGSEQKNAPRDRHRGELRIMYQDAMREYMQANGGKKPDPKTADEIARNVAKLYATRIVSSRVESHFFGPDTLDTRTIQQENEHRIRNGKPLVYEAAIQYNAQFTEAQRDAVRSAYRNKYGVDPTDNWVNSYLIRATNGSNP